MTHRIIFLTALSLFAVSSCAKNAFDEEHIAISFGVLSDTHVDGTMTNAGHKFKSALEQLRDRAFASDADGLDGILIAGDLTNNPYKNPAYYSQIDTFKVLYESVFDLSDVPMVFTPGNHDLYREWTDSAIVETGKMMSRFGGGWFQTDTDTAAAFPLGCRHAVVKGYDILGIVPVGRNPVIYPEAAVRWLDSTLNALTSAHPKRYVMVLTHPMIYNTVYGSTLGDYWDTEALTPVLEKYPQAVTFSGHLHFPLNDPRSIWQGTFTALGCGCTRYMAIENGGYEYMAGRTIMKDCGDFSQGLLVQFDRKGNMKITRMDFFNKDVIGEPWIILHPSKDLSHLKPYSHTARSEANTPPVLTSAEIIRDTMKNDTPNDTVTAVFAAGQDDEFVHHYVLTLTDATGDTVKVKKLLADFYRIPRPDMMKKEWREPFVLPSPGEYTLTIEAFDSWGAESNAVKCQFQ